MNEIHAAMLEEVTRESEAAINELHQKQSEEMSKAAGVLIHFNPISALLVA